MKKKVMRPVRAWEWEHNDILIPSDLFIGLKWKDDSGKRYVSGLGPSRYLNGKRIAVLNETTYIGSIGGMHYYGSINVIQPGGKCLSDGDAEFSHGGYLGKNAPSMDSLRIQVTRRLTKVERDMNGEVIGKVGERTYRFNEEKDVRPAAIKLFKKKFGPGWILVPDSWDDGERPILCET